MLSNLLVKTGDGVLKDLCVWAKSKSGQSHVGIPQIKQSIFTTEQLAEYFRLYLKLNAALHCCSERKIKSIMYGGCNLPTKADQEFHYNVCVCLLWENRVSKASVLVMFFLSSPCQMAVDIHCGEVFWMATDVN